MKIINEIYRIALVLDKPLKQSRWCGWLGNKVSISADCKMQVFVVPGGMSGVSGKIHFTLAPYKNDWHFKDTPLHTVDKMNIPYYLM